MKAWTALAKLEGKSGGGGFQSGTGIEIIGAARIAKILENLEPKLARKIMDHALREGSKVFQKAAKAKAKSIVGGELGGKIAKSVRIRKAKRKKNQYGTNTGTSELSDPDLIHVTDAGTRYFIPAAVEYGHTFPYVSENIISHGSGKRGKSERGAITSAKAVKPRSFMRSAYDETKMGVVAVVGSRLQRGIRELVTEKT